MTSRSSFQLQALANVYYGVCDYGMDEMSWCCLIAVAAFYCIQSDTEAETSARAELSSFCAALHNMYVRLSKLLLHILLILIWFLIFFKSTFLLASELRWNQASFSGRLHSHRFTHTHHKFAQNATSPVPSDKTPNIIDIVPRQPTGAAANKDSPSLCLQWSTWIRKHHFNSAKASLSFR